MDFIYSVKKADVHMRSNTKEAVEARRAAWKQRVQDELSRMVELLKARPNVKKVILFGSFARGNPRWRSDVDLVVVQQTDRRFMDRLGDLLLYLHPTVGCDILAYTPEEWEELSRKRKFLQHIRMEGVVLYDA